MPRQARRSCDAHVYHVLNRGTGQQLIFEDSDDRAFFIKRVSELLAEENGALYAWCLMGNHYHLLLRMHKEELSRFMHRLQTNYAGYFNRVHGRSGALFGTRFKSEPVESDEYLMTVVRYIHANPVKAGLSKDMDYRWSSFGEYTGSPHFAQTDFVLDVFGGKQSFLDFHRGPVEDSCLDIPVITSRLSDTQALNIAIGLYGDAGVGAIKAMKKPDRDSAIATLKARGLGIRQIQRLTGLSTSVITRAK